MSHNEDAIEALGRVRYKAHTPDDRPGISVLKARITMLEDSLLAAWELLTDAVPSTPSGMAAYYWENLAQDVDEIKSRRNLPNL